MANREFRFGLGSIASPRSGIWRLWTHEDDLHLAVQTSREEVTLLAYPTGRWRISSGGAVSKWTRPREFRPGWTRGPDLVIPHAPAPVRLPPRDPVSSDSIVWLPPPAPGQQARFTLLFATPRAEGSLWRPPDTPGTQGIAVLPLRTVGALHLCRVDEPIATEAIGFDLRDSGAGDVPSSDALEIAVVVSADQAGNPSLWESHDR
jgi:hypothetical protein